MRPVSIVSFERRYGVAIALNLIGTALMLPRLQAIAGTPGASPLSPSTLSLLTLFGILLDLALWYLVARQGSNIARWILTGLVAVGIVSLLSSIVLHRLPGAVVGILSILVVVLKAMAVGQLFRRDAAPFFAGAVR